MAELMLCKGMSGDLPVPADGAKPPPFPVMCHKPDRGWAWVAGGLFAVQLWVTFAMTSQAAKWRQHDGPEFSVENLFLLLAVGFFAALPALGGSFIAAYCGRGVLRWMLALTGIVLWCVQSWWPYFG